MPRAAKPKSSLLFTFLLDCRVTGNQVEFSLGSITLLFLVPEIHKEPRCCRTVPRIVVVTESKDFHDFAVAHQRFEKLRPNSSNRQYGR